MQEYQSPLPEPVKVHHKPHRAPIGTANVYPIQKQLMKVDIQVQRTAETLDQGHSTVCAMGFTKPALCARWMASPEDLMIFCCGEKVVQPQVGCLQQVRPNIGIAPSKPPDVHIGREVETPPAQSGIGVIQLVDCELHDRIMTGNWVWLVEVRGGFWPIPTVQGFQISGY